jgi:hypothetical protein
LPKVPSFFSLSPQRGERARVRGDRKKLLVNGITMLFVTFKSELGIILVAEVISNSSNR